jgi:N-formylglutamate deformylase
MIIHIPHSSTCIPNDLLGQYILDEKSLQAELLFMTDRYTDELFGDIDGSVDVRFPVSRLVVDPERFEDDAVEVMATLGMGVVYEVTSHLLPLRRPISSEERHQLLDQYYHPHHEMLSQLVESELAALGNALVIDAHSFPSVARPYEMNPSASRPEICIGTDEFHSSPDLVRTAVSLFEAKGFAVELNTPFSGALVPMKFYGKDSRVQALMIEVRRDLYMDEESGAKLSGFIQVQDALRSILTSLQLRE